jgi:hypothetical protein
MTVLQVQEDGRLLDAFDKNDYSYKSIVFDKSKSGKINDLKYYKLESYEKAVQTMEEVMKRFDDKTVIATIHCMRSSHLDEDELELFKLNLVRVDQRGLNDLTSTLIHSDCKSGAAWVRLLSQDRMQCKNPMLKLLLNVPQVAGNPHALRIIKSIYNSNNLSSSVESTPATSLLSSPLNHFDRRAPLSSIENKNQVQTGKISSRELIQ